MGTKLKGKILLGLLLLGFLTVSFSVYSSAQFGAQPETILDKIKDKSPKEAANIKADEFVKLGSIDKVRVGDYFIHVLSIEKLDGGIQVLARAWDSNDQQIGFGPDGTVDIEKFKIYDPGVLVEDTNGPVVRTTWDKVVGITTKKWREDVRESILRRLANIIRVKQEKFSSERIIPFKVGNTTYTLFPSAGAVYPVDGMVENNPVATTWALLRAGTGTGSSDTSNQGPLFHGNGTAFDDMIRGLVVFATEAITDTDTINSATFSIRGNNNFATIPTNIVVASGTIALTNDVQNSDFERNVGPALFSDTAIAVSSFSTSAYNDYLFNADGRAGINKASTTALAVLTSHDQANTEPAATDGYSGSYYQNADLGGTEQDPQLVIETTAATGGGAAVSRKVIFLQAQEQ